MPLTGFALEIDRKIAAGYQAMAVASRERPRVVGALRDVAESLGWPLVVWTPDDGFSVRYDPEPDPDRRLDTAATVGSSAYVGDVRAAIAAAAYEMKFPAAAVVLLLDAHELLAAQHDQGAVARSVLAHAVDNQLLNTAAGIQRPLVFCHPSNRVHPDVDAKIEPVPLPLLTPGEIAGEVVDLASAGLPAGVPTGLEGPDGDGLRARLGAACAGLAFGQVQNVLAEGLVRHGRFRPEMLADVRKYRTAAINASGLVKVYEGPETFADVAGLDALKRFLAGLAAPRRPGSRAVARGALLVGLPGVGKTFIAKALANETGRIALELNVGDVLGGVVGQSEANLREALRIVEGAGASVLVVDEMEKAIAGAVGGHSDGGVMSRLVSELLRWLNDHPSDFIAVGCMNSLDNVPAEMTRQGRFNANFFLDAPSVPERAALWDAYTRKFGLDPAQPRPKDDDWTGADVAGCCEMADLFGLPLVAAAEYVIPVTVTAGEKLDALRRWAAGRCLDATYGSKYDPKRRAAAIAAATTGAAAAPQARALRRRPNDPSAN